MGKMTRLLVAIALACLGLGGAAQMVLAETSVQGSQTSDGAASTSGSAQGTNASSFRGGPTATGSTTADSQQLGSNSGSASQNGDAKAGDSVAGAQVTGAVADDVTVQNQNSSTGASALTGDATVTNVLDDGTSVEFGLGPLAIGAGRAQASQVGNNSLDTVQTASASTGDAVAGSQVTGIVGDGEHTVQLQNDAADAGTVASGDAVGSNVVAPAVGPISASEGDASTSQIGDNDAVISQSTDVTTGDALHGSQVTGIVGGSATVQGQNSSTGGNTATSGDSTASNDALQGFGGALVGPQASSGATAQATQNGDNAVDLSQSIEGSTGDALSGAQVTGGVGDQGGFLTVQNQQASDGDATETGDFFALNDVSGAAGPVADGNDAGSASQIGDNAAALEQSVDASTGDALTGSQVTGAVGYNDVTVQNQNDASGLEPGLSISPGSSTSGDIGASAEDLGLDPAGRGGDINQTDISVGPSGSGASSAAAEQIGDNAVSAAQSVELATGDSVAGGQVTGVVTSGSNPTVNVQNQNSSLGMASFTGNVFADELNQFDGFVDGDQVAGPVAFTGGVGQATQNGDNAASVAQTADVSTGDAVAGGQVTGVVADGAGADVTIQNQNSSEGDDAVSGDGDFNSFNDVDGGDLGPFSLGTTSSASQIGDNAADYSQAASFASGDAVGGAQVSGVVAGSSADVTVQNQNDALDSDATSGSLLGGDDLQEVDASIGPFAASSQASNTSAEQIGDNSAAISQAFDASTGDAVGGAQVSGVVAGDGSDIDLQLSNNADSSDATSGSITGEDGNDTEVSAGPAVETADTVAVAQVGDNTVAVDQAAALGTGDAVGGAQVSGVVTGDDSDVTLQAQNAAGLDAANSATSGLLDFSDSANEVTDEGQTFAGPDGSTSGTPGSSQATQNGDNTVAIAQAADLGTGDAVNGSQVGGVVAGSDSAIDVQGQNACGVGGECGDAVTGDIVFGPDTNEIDGNVGPVSDSADSSQASQIGDNGLTADQSLVAATGDAVSGSQVTGTVAGDGSETTVQNQNASDAATATSGDASGLGNEATDLFVGPSADSDGTAAAEQIGDDTLSVAQDASVSSGDAVAGSQVTGTVGGDHEVQVANSSDAPTAVSGATIDTTNTASGGVGPLAEGDTASTQLAGDTAAETSQGIGTQTGDAVAGAQIGGAVA